MGVVDPLIETVEVDRVAGVGCVALDDEVEWDLFDQPHSFGEMFTYSLAELTNDEPPRAQLDDAAAV